MPSPVRGGRVLAYGVSRRLILFRRLRRPLDRLLITRHRLLFLRDFELGGVERVAFERAFDINLQALLLLLALEHVGGELVAGLVEFVRLVARDDRETALLARGHER